MSCRGGYTHRVGLGSSADSSCRESSGSEHYLGGSLVKGSLAPVLCRYVPGVCGGSGRGGVVVPVVGVCAYVDVPEANRGQSWEVPYSEGVVHPVPD